MILATYSFVLYLIVYTPDVGVDFQYVSLFKTEKECLTKKAELKKEGKSSVCSKWTEDEWSCMDIIHHFYRSSNIINHKGKIYGK